MNSGFGVPRQTRPEKPAKPREREHGRRPYRTDLSKSFAWKSGKQSAYSLVVEELQKIKTHLLMVEMQWEKRLDVGEGMWQRIGEEISAVDHLIKLFSAWIEREKTKNAQENNGSTAAGPERLQ